MLGWTQKDAVDVLGLARQSITDVAEKMRTQVSGIQHQFYNDKKSIDEIKEFHHLDETTSSTALIS